MSATLEDGRRISWAEYGAPSGAPLVLLHGTPGSRLPFGRGTGLLWLPGSA